MFKINQPGDKHVLKLPLYYNVDLQIHHQIKSNLIVICKGDSCRFYLII